MDLQIRPGGVKITHGMQEFIDRRMSKLEQMIVKIVDARLELRTEHDRTGTEVTIAQLTLHTGRQILRAEEVDRESARAIDAAFDKLESQVRRYIDKRKSRRKSAPPNPHSLTLPVCRRLTPTPPNRSWMRKLNFLNMFAPSGSK